MDAKILRRLHTMRADVTPENIEAAMAQIIKEQNELQDRTVPVGGGDDDTLGPSGNI